MSITRDFSFVIVGGGILGSALATLAAGYGLEPLVLRRPDVGSPNADTLRNQGWLQSGIMYPINQFSSPEAYATFAAQTYIAGRELLAMCGLPLPESGGLLGVSNNFHLNQLARKRELLKLSDNEFTQLENSEAKRVMGSHFEQGSTYYRIPDGPFNEAVVLNHFREEATRAGAVFIEVDNPVRLARTTDAVRVEFDGREIVSPTVVITAGAGSFDLMQQCGIKLNGDLQRTPLVVGDAPSDMPASIVVDLDRGFSAVRHDRGHGSSAAVVMGTRAKTLPAPDPAERVIPVADQAQFGSLVPPGFQPSLAYGRYTAGYEVMPKRGHSPNAYEPWIHPDGPVIFGSPGRATVSAMAAQKLLADVIARWKSNRSQRTSSIDLSDCNKWISPIAMHYMPFYSYNDAEAERVQEI